MQPHSSARASNSSPMAHRGPGDAPSRATPIALPGAAARPLGLHPTSSSSSSSSGGRRPLAQSAPVRSYVPPEAPLPRPAVPRVEPPLLDLPPSFTDSAALDLIEAFASAHITPPGPSGSPARASAVSGSSTDLSFPGTSSTSSSTSSASLFTPLSSTSGADAAASASRGFAATGVPTGLESSNSRPLAVGPDGSSSAAAAPRTSLGTGPFFPFNADPAALSAAAAKARASPPAPVARSLTNNVSFIPFPELIKDRADFGMGRSPTILSILTGADDAATGAAGEPAPSSAAAAGVASLPLSKGGDGSPGAGGKRLSSRHPAYRPLTLPAAGAGAVAGAVAEDEEDEEDEQQQQQQRGAGDEDEEDDELPFKMTLE